MSKLFLFSFGSSIDFRKESLIAKYKFAFLCLLGLCDESCDCMSILVIVEMHRSDVYDASTTKAIHYSDWRVQHLLARMTHHVTWWTLEHVELRHTHVFMCADCVRRVRSAVYGMLDACCWRFDRQDHPLQRLISTAWVLHIAHIHIRSRSSNTSSTHTIVTQSYRLAYSHKNSHNFYHSRNKKHQTWFVKIVFIFIWIIDRFPKRKFDWEI